MTKEYKKVISEINLLLKRFDEWVEDGNVITINECGVKYYATQDALYKNRIESKDDLYDYFITEFNPLNL